MHLFSELTGWKAVLSSTGLMSLLPSHQTTKAPTWKENYKKSLWKCSQQNGKFTSPQNAIFGPWWGKTSQKLSSVWDVLYQHFTVLTAACQLAQSCTVTTQMQSCYSLNSMNHCFQKLLIQTETFHNCIQLSLWVYGSADFSNVSNWERNIWTCSKAAFYIH